VWQPEYINGFTASFDYFRIKIAQAISFPSVTDVLNQCYSAAFNPTFAFNSACALIGRSPVTGTFNGTDAKGVVTVRTNSGSIKTYGYDLSLRYNLRLPGAWGKVAVSFDGTETQSWQFQPSPLSANHECAGEYSIACGAVGPDVRPKYKWTQRTVWSFADFDFSYQWRHLSAVKEEDTVTKWLPQFARIPNFEYFDLAAVWRATATTSLNFTVTNVANKRPPIVGGTIGTTAYNSGNTFPAFYDPVGRYFTLSATARF
jgi:outer membrane receptor protein involved in Fe transport